MKSAKKILGMMSLTALLLFACEFSFGGNAFPGDEIQNDNLVMRQNEDAYEMYYPSYYEEADNDIQDISYSNIELNSIGGTNNIGLGIEVSEDRGIKPSEQDCEDIAEEMAESLGGTYSDVSVLDEGGMVGCYLKVQATLYEVDLVSENRVLVLKGGDKATVYAANITYEASASSDEIKDLQDSLAKFKIK